MGQLDGKIVAVTGGSSGLGQAICILFAKEGAAVAVNYNSTPGGAQETVDKIVEAGGRAIAIKANVTLKADCERFVAETVNTFGHLDIFIANSGIFPRSPFLELPEEEWNQCIAINLTGAFLSCQAAARQMVSQGQGGKIILMGSTAGQQPSDRIAAYGASKSGLNQLAKVMAVELAAHDITVNVIAPGLIETRITKDITAFLDATHTPLSVPMQRMGHPIEIANLTLFVASDACNYMTGSVLLADGGYTIMGGLDDPSIYKRHQ